MSNTCDSCGNDVGSYGCNNKDCGDYDPTGIYKENDNDKSMCMKNEDKPQFLLANEEEDIINGFLCQIIEDQEKEQEEEVKKEEASCSTDPIKPKEDKPKKVRTDRKAYFKAYNLANQASIKEAKAEYYETIKEQKKEDYLENAEKIKQYRKDNKYNCEVCDIVIGINSKACHLKTAKHKKNAEAQAKKD